MSQSLIETLSWLPFPVFRVIMRRFGLSPADYNNVIIDAIKPSTITVGGYFTNIALHEARDINKFIASEPVVKIGSNYGELYASGYADPVKKPKTSKRGRKPKPKKPKTRIQGSGKYFNSQITFVIRSPSNPIKLYKFKVFRNGKFQVPGVLSSSMDDIDRPLEILMNYFDAVYNPDGDKSKRVTVQDRVVQMRNCKTILTDPCLTINTGALGKLIEADKFGNNEMRISKVEYMSAQNSSKIVVKFSRPTKDKASKKTTLKILKQKINIEGAVGFDGVDEIYQWLNDLMLDNYYRVINDIDAPDLASDSSDTEMDTSDSDIEVESLPQRSRQYNPYDYI